MEFIIIYDDIYRKIIINPDQIVEIYEDPCSDKVDLILANNNNITFIVPTNSFCTANELYNKKAMNYLRSKIINK